MQNNSSDYELVRRTAQKDVCAYRVLVNRHLDIGLRMAERMLGNRQDAEEIMQETCLKIWKEAPRWKPQAKFSTWLYRVIFNACLDRKRRFKPVLTNVMDELIDEAPLVDTLIIEREKANHIKIALQKLPNRQRVAIILNYYEDMTNYQGAEIMGIAINAYQQLLFRAKQNLKTHLSEHIHDGKAGSTPQKLAGSI